MKTLVAVAAVTILAGCQMPQGGWSGGGYAPSYSTADPTQAPAANFMRGFNDPGYVPMAQPVTNDWHERNMREVRAQEEFRRRMQEEERRRRMFQPGPQRW